MSEHLHTGYERTGLSQVTSIITKDVLKKNYPMDVAK